MHTTQIIREAFGTILAHPWMTLRATVGPLLLVVMVVVTLEMLLGDMTSIRFGAAFLYIPIAALVSFLCIYWAAVAWHRFVLLGERPGLLPKFHLQRILHYIWSFLVIGFLSSLCALPFALFALPLVQGAIDTAAVDVSGSTSLWEQLNLTVLQGIFLLAMILLMIFVPGYVLLRLSPVLPAAAVGEDLSCGEAWILTGTGRGSIALLALAYVVVLTCLGVVWEDVLAPPLGDARVLVDLVGQWIVFVISLSVITTIYRRVVIEADGAT